MSLVTRYVPEEQEADSLAGFSAWRRRLDESVVQAERRLKEEGGFKGKEGETH